jgi:dynein heavy chain, axonemal
MTIWKKVEESKFSKSLNFRKKATKKFAKQVEWNMKEAVRAAMELAVMDYPERERPQWAITHCAQCVLNGSQVYWTDEVEEAFGVR